MFSRSTYNIFFWETFIEKKRLKVDAEKPWITYIFSTMFQFEIKYLGYLTHWHLGFVDVNHSQSFQGLFILTASLLLFDPLKIPNFYSQFSLFLRGFRTLIWTLFGIWIKACQLYYNYTHCNQSYSPRPNFNLNL